MFQYVFSGGGGKNKHFFFLFGLAFCLFLAPPPCSFSEQNRKHVVAENGETTHEQLALPDERDFTYRLLSLSFKKNSKWLLGKNFLVKSEGGKTPAPIKELMSRKCSYIIGILSEKEIPIAHPEVPQYLLL